MKQVSISAASDSRICVVGENGAGKTTLLKLVMGELTPIKGFVHLHRGIRFGYFSQHHVDQLKMDVTPVGLLQQKFPGKKILPPLSNSDSFMLYAYCLLLFDGFLFLFTGQTVEEYRRHLGRFGISGDLALQSIASLSGGQKSRVAFTVMCYPGPNFLVLDEPTNHLDVETIEALSVAINKYNVSLTVLLFFPFSWRYRAPV